MAKFAYIPCYSNSESLNALALVVELTPHFLNKVRRLSEQVRRMECDNVYCIEAWYYGFDAIDEAEWETYEPLGIEPSGDTVFLDYGVPDEHCMRIEVPTIKVSSDDVSLTCVPKHTSVEIFGSMMLSELDKED